MEKERGGEQHKRLLAHVVAELQRERATLSLKNLREVEEVATE